MKKKITAGIVSAVLAISLTACGSAGRTSEKNTEISKELEYDHSMELEYAEEFSVDYYQDGYALVTIADDGQYLVVPEGKTAPDDLSGKILQYFSSHYIIYIWMASSVMDHVCVTGCSG